MVDREKIEILIRRLVHGVYDEQTMSELRSSIVGTCDHNEIANRILALGMRAHNLQRAESSWDRDLIGEESTSIENGIGSLVKQLVELGSEDQGDAQGE